MIGMMSMMALSVDVGVLCLAKTELQRSADAAVLAAASTLINSNGTANIEEAIAIAKEYALANSVIGKNDQVTLLDQDIVIGQFDPVTKQVIPNLLSVNAIQIWCRRDSQHGNSVNLFFAPALGITDRGMSATAIANLGPVTGSDIVPMALRGPNFGPVDPAVSQANPGKDGPSSPANGQYFEVGEQVTIFTYGNGKKAPVHLTLKTTDSSSESTITPAEAKKILRGDSAPTPVKSGDTFEVFNGGTGSNSYGKALEVRLDTSSTDPSRDILMPVIDELPDSRDAKGRLTGKIQVSDFVSVHLDEIITTTVPDPNNAGKSIQIKLLVGTVTRRITSLAGSGGGSETSGAGGGTVAAVQLIY